MLYQNFSWKEKLVYLILAESIFAVLKKIAALKFPSGDKVTLSALMNTLVKGIVRTYFADDIKIQYFASVGAGTQSSAIYLWLELLYLW